MSTVFNVKQGIRLEEKNSLNKLVEKLKTALALDVNIERLGEQKDKTDTAIKDYLNTANFESPITRANLKALEAKVKEQSEEINNYVNECDKNNLYIEKLEKLKDKEAVSKAKADCGMLDAVEIFKEKAAKVHNALSDVNRAVRMLIFADYSKTDLPNLFYDNDYRNAYAEAKQSGYITQMDKIDYSKKNIKKIREAIEEFENYIDKLQDEYNDIDEYLEDVDFDIKSKEFWEKAFDISLY
jgi:uncharacterized protein YukE